MGANIPLPALQVGQGVQPIDLGKIYQNIAQLQNMGMQRQMMQQQVQAGQLENQQRQMDIDSQKAVVRAYTEANGDLNAAIPLAAKYGAKPQALIQLKQSAMDQQKANLQLLQEKGNRAVQEADFMAGAHDTVANAPAEQRPAIYKQQLQALQNAGIDTSNAPQDYPGDQQFAIMGVGLRSHSAQLKDLASRTDLAKTQAQTAEATANANKTNAEMQAYQQSGMTPGVPLDKMEAAAWLKKNPGKDLSDFMAYKAKLVPQFNFNLQNQGVPAQTFAPGTSPDQMYQAFGAKAGVVRGIVEGRQSPPSSFAQKTPYWQDVMQKVYQVDPQWSEQRAQIRKAFTSGTPEARNIGSLNTATAHLDTYYQAAMALQNGSFRPGNALWNAVSQALGQPAPTTFEGLRQAVAGEQANALKGQATDPEIAHILSTIPNSSSPQQFADNVQASLHIMAQKLNTYDERYHQQIPGDTSWSPVLPQARDVFQRHGITFGGQRSNFVQGGNNQAGGNDPFAQFGGRRHQ